MSKKCEICGEEIEEEYGKLKGTMLKIVENKKTKWLYVCNQCQKEPRWIETAKVKGA